MRAILPKVIMLIWWLIGIFGITVACVVLTPVVIALWNTVRVVSKAGSPEHRLQIPNIWTEIQEVKDAGSIQRMRMEDGNFILLSAGLDTMKVFVSPRLDSIESLVELASFPLVQTHESRREQEKIGLNQLRTAVGWPKSIDELRHKLENASPPTNLRVAE